MMRLSRPAGLIVFGSSPRRALIRSLVWALLLLAVGRFLLVPVRIYGDSMKPTYQPGTFNLVYTLRYRGRPPRRGDVVAVSMAGRRLLLLKRVIGLPGETVFIGNGTVFIDGEPIEEPYVEYNAHWNVSPVTLDGNEYFVIGDNRGMPSRLHTFGRTTGDRIFGVPLL